MSIPAQTTKRPGRKMTLLIRDVPKETLDGIEKIGASMRPAVRRNDLILHFLREAAAGRLTIQSPGES